jgi:ATP-dependent DNA helicase RecG
LYQDEIRGPLIGLADRVLDTIYTKYFKGLIHYEGIQRVDNYPMPHNVLREAVLNAIIHKDYSTGNPIHIKIYDGKVIIYNDCSIPVNINPEKLLESIVSIPHNPLIAGAFFRSGQIEAWGRGIEKMKKGCLADNLPEPEFTIFPTIFSICFQIRNNNKTKPVNTENDFGINETQKKIVAVMLVNSKVTMEQIAENVGISKRQVESIISDLKSKGLVGRVGARKNGQWIVKQSTQST